MPMRVEYPLHLHHCLVCDETFDCTDDCRVGWEYECDTCWKKDDGAAYWGSLPRPYYCVK